MRRTASLFSAAAKSLQDMKAMATHLDEHSKPFFAISLNAFFKAQSCVERQEILEAKKFIESAINNGEELSGTTPIIMGYMSDLYELDEKISSALEGAVKLKK